MCKVDTQKYVEENTDEEDDYDPTVDEHDNKVLFCCNDCSFFVSAKKFSGCKKNCIR